MNNEERRLYNQKYYQKNKEKWKNQKVKTKEWKKKNKDKVFEQKRRKRERDKLSLSIQLKNKSRRKANYKIDIKGVSCFDCNKKQAIERHHEDYNKSYDVILLCGSCHRKRHNLHYYKGGLKNEKKN